MARPSVGAWWRWMRAPWSRVTTAVALVAAVAAPVLLLVAADLWRAAAEDQVSGQVTDAASTTASGVDVELEAAFDAEALSLADDEVRRAALEIGTLAPLARTLYTFPGLGVVDGADGPVGAQVRLVARPDALDHVSVVEKAAATEGGVWISSWLAERHGLGLGDLVGFEAGVVGDEAFNDFVAAGGATGVFPIVGIYEELWSVDGTAPGGYWDGVPPELLPRYLGAFQAPGFSLVLTDEQTLASSGLTGAARWIAPVTELPATLDGLRALVREYRGFESALVRGSVADAFAPLAAPPGRRPSFTTTLEGTLADAEAAAARLDRPIETARTVGVVTAFAALGAAGVFLVDRRRSEFRLLAAEGERWPSMAGRVALQLLTPAAVGMLVGVAGAVIVADVFGPAEGRSLDPVAWGAVLATGALAVAVTALTAGLLGQHTLGIRAIGTGRSGRVVAVGMLALAVATTYVWADLGDSATGDDVDRSMIWLPILALALAAALATAITGLALRGLLRVRRRPGAIELLVVRRVASGGIGLRLATAALGIGLGLVLLSISLVATIDRSVDVKLRTEVGGTTRFDLFGDVPDLALPEATTVLLVQDTVVTPGSDQARVLAVDDETFVAALDWPDEFGLSTSEVAELLAADASESLPVVALQDEPLPAVGAFGATRPFPYRVVARVDSLPLAGEFGSTLMVSADQLDRFATAQLSELEGAETAEVAAPTTRFRRHLVSQLDPAELEQALDGTDLGVRARVSVGQLSGAPSIVATRSAFDYLRVLGFVAAVGATAALLLYLASRRRARALAGVMVRSMGMSAGRAALVTTLEVTGLVVVTVVSAFIAVPLLGARLADRFDPSPQVPPDLGVELEWPVLVAASVVVVAVVGLVVWFTELRSSRRPAGEVIRRAG